MISFQILGRYGRLGNQLYQYAFLRLSAQRLGVKFYCPAWVGDEIFELDDKTERAERPEGITKTYSEPPYYFGFNKNALKIEDGTDIKGFFQTEKYFDKAKVRRWYTFREEAIKKVKVKYQNIQFAKSTGLHLRFGDKIASSRQRAMYYVAPISYYRRALSRVKYKENILIFSDEIETASKHLKDLKGNVIYIEGNEPYEDLYLMTQCHDFVCSVSTINWWGAWLNAYQDKTIVCPKEGPCRPGCNIKNNDYLPKEWTKIRALRFVIDDYWVSYYLKNLKMIYIR